MKKYGRAKTRALCTSIEDVFDDSGQQTQPAGSKKINKAPWSKTTETHKRYFLRSQVKKPVDGKTVAESKLLNQKIGNKRFLCQAKIKKHYRSKKVKDDNIFKTAFNEQYNFDKTLRVTLNRIDKSLRVHLTRLDKEIQVNLTKLNLADYSNIHVPEKSFQSGMISSDVEKFKLDTSTDDIENVNSLIDGLNKLNMLTSTPVTLHKTPLTEVRTFPNISGFSNKNNCSAHVAFTPENVQSNVASTDLIFPNITPALSSSSIFTKRQAHCNVSQISRSHEVLSKVESFKRKAALYYMSSISCNSENEIISSHASDTDMKVTLSTLLELSNEEYVINFQDVYNWRNFHVQKIGEGSYGEIFALRRKKKVTVIKIIPFSEEKDDPSFQSMESVFSEVKVAMCLSGLRSNEKNKTKNFNLLKRFKVVKGKFPDKLMAAWDAFSDAKTNFCYRPDFGNHQTFAILELEYGGKDLATFVMRNASEAECIFKQIAIALAIGEEENLFEHRDLHLGNILVQRNASKKISYVLNGRPFFIRNEGLIVSIIDFTLSRVFDSGCVFYNDLADEDIIFNQSGDFQFHVYKMTRDFLKNKWKNSLLVSNVMWLGYLTMKLIDSSYSRPTNKNHAKSMVFLKKVLDGILKCSSALDVVKTFNIIDFVPTSKGTSNIKNFKFFARK